MLIGSDGPSVDAMADGRPGRRTFECLFEDAPAAMALVTADDRVVHANAALSRLTGYEHAQLTSLTLAELTHPEDREAVRRRPPGGGPG